MGRRLPATNCAGARFPRESGFANELFSAFGDCTLMGRSSSVDGRVKSVLLFGLSLMT